MKKIFIVLFVLLNCSLCFSQVLVGVRGFLSPNFVTSGNIVAENDLYASIDVYGILNSEYRDYFNASRKNFGVSGDIFLQFGVTPKISVEGAVGITTEQGYTTEFTVEEGDESESVLLYKRAFNTIDFSVLAKYFLSKSSLGYIALSLGPNVSYTGDTIEEGYFIDSTTTAVEVYEAFQNPLLFGIKGGAEAAIAISKKTLFTVNALGFCDFTPMFNKELTGEWFSKAVGNRWGFYIGIGIAYSLK